MQGDWKGDPVIPRSDPNRTLRSGLGLIQSASLQSNIKNDPPTHENHRYEPQIVYPPQRHRGNGICRAIFHSLRRAGAGGRPGANDRIGIAVIGPGRQGGGLLGSAGRSKEARIVAIADVNLPRAREAAAKYKAEVYKDYRKLLERKDVDAVITATPEHWRALTCIHACQAGKDIYAEKPMTLTIREGRLMVEAVRKYGRVFQCGSQQRSQVENHIGCKLVREGAHRQDHQGHRYNYPSPWECALPGPAGAGWTRLGPVVRPYRAGALSPRPLHPARQSRLALLPSLLRRRDDRLGRAWLRSDPMRARHGRHPARSRCGPERENSRRRHTRSLNRADRGNKLCSVPKVFFRYANGTVMELGERPARRRYFHRRKGHHHDRPRPVRLEPPELASGPLEKADCGSYASKRKPPGCHRGSHAPASPLPGENGEKAAPHPARGGHMQNWFDCIRSRQKPIADVEIGHRSATVCHLGNIARWTNRQLHWDPSRNASRKRKQTSISIASGGNRIELPAAI